MIALTARRRRRAQIDRRPHWFELPEEPDPDDLDADAAYDRFGMMMKVDSLDRPWRDLVNEYGFTQVIQSMQQTGDASTAARLLAIHRAARQGR